MTPERAEYHRIMLMVGLRDKFDQEFDWALENENPLSDIILSLTSCASDTEETIAVLHSFALDNEFDEEEVYNLVLDDIRSRYLDGILSRSQVTTTLYSIANYLDAFWNEPWDKLTHLSNALELYEDKLISENAFIECFDAWLLRNEHLDVWQLQRNINMNSKKQKSRKQPLLKSYFCDYDAFTEKEILEVTAHGISLRNGKYIDFCECSANFETAHPGSSGKTVGEREISDLSFTFYTNHFINNIFIFFKISFN